MSSMTDAYEWQGRTVVDAGGDKIGKIDDIYVDDATGEPAWALVNTGLFGTKSNFVPLGTASPSGGDVKVEVTKDQVSNAPGVDTDGELSPEEEQALYSHYSLDFGGY